MGVGVRYQHVSAGRVDLPEQDITYRPVFLGGYFLHLRFDSAPCQIVGKLLC